MKHNPTGQNINDNDNDNDNDSFLISHFSFFIHKTKLFSLLTVSS